MEKLSVLLVVSLVSRAQGVAVSVSPVTQPTTHGEGPHWDPDGQQLYFVDIHEKNVHRYDPATGNDYKLQLPTNVTLVIPVRDSAGWFAVTQGRTLSWLRWDDSCHGLYRIASVDDDKPDNRFNDGKADVAGRIWAGTMGSEPSVGHVTPYQGTLYRLDVGSTHPVSVISPVSISNGIAWDSDIMYYIDTATNFIAAYDFNPALGTVKNGRIVFNITSTGIPGVMDGMTIDANGNLWVALFGGWRVVQVNPRSGRVLRVVSLPAERVTSVAWGGRTLSDLYVTSSRSGLSEDQIAEQPLSGCVFRITGLGVTGTTAFTAVKAATPLT